MPQRSAVRNKIEAAVARVLIASLEKSPRPVADRLGSIYAGLLDLAVPRLRRIADRNLSFAYGRRDARWRAGIIDGVFASIGRLLVAFCRFPKINAANVHEWIEYEGFEHYRDGKQKGRGILFATAHLGNWELSAFAHALMTEPMNVVVRPLDNPTIDEIVRSRRGLSGNKLISKREFARSILHALRNNEAVGILLDQNTAADEGVFVPFFGKSACSGVTFAKLAARSGAAVIPGFAVWRPERRKYLLRFFPEVPMTGDAHADTAAIQAAIEYAIREDADQWLWIHRRWKTRPHGESGMYD